VTRVEAAEIIMSEQPFLVCKRCDGKGTILSGKDNWATSCALCSSTGAKANHRYREACTILNLRMPQLDSNWDGSKEEPQWR
jgi:hypothetical protein